MRIAIYGAGAIGGVVGAGMAAAGEDVLMVDIDADHVEMMNTSGLRIRSASGESHTAVRAALTEEVEGTFDLVFLAVKSQHTDVSLDAIIPHMTSDSAVISLQNGINEPHIAERIGPERTIGCMVDFSADYHGPGLIERGRPGGLYVGELDGRTTSRIEEVRRLLAYSTPTHVSDNVMGFVWSKLCKGTIDATTALVDADIGEVRGNKKTQLALVEAVREAVLVAQADGIRLEPFDHFDPLAFVDDSPSGRERAFKVLDEMAEGAKSDLKVRTGYWRDIIVRRRKTEIEYVTGEVVSRGERLGVPTPVNKRQLEQFAEIEAGTRTMDWENLYELLEIASKSATV